MMFSQRTPIDPVIFQRLREKAEEAEAAYELTEPSDKVAAFLRFDAALRELSDALMGSRPPRCC